MKKYNLYFDLDGTLYTFSGTNFWDSSLRSGIQANAIELLEELGEKEPKKKLQEMLQENQEGLSLMFEKRYPITRYEYFERTWDLNPEDHLIIHDDVKKIFEDLHIHNIYILSDAPKVRISNVIDYLGIGSYIQSIISGEGDKRKSNGRVFEDIDAKDAYVIGDQIHSDIIPPMKHGFKTIYITRDGEICDDSSHTVSSLHEIPDILLG